jgi:tetratricopeptide (TPR) repeat protein
MRHRCKGRVGLLRVVMFAVTLYAAAGEAGAAVVSRQVLIDFSEHLASAFNERDTSMFMQRFDRKVFVDRVVRCTHLPEEQRQQVMKIARQGADRMGQVIQHRLGKNARVKFLRIRPSAADQPDLFNSLYRVDFGDDGLSYWELQLDSRSPSDIRIVDWINYSNGSLVSEGMGDMFGLLLGDDSKPVSGGAASAVKPGNRRVLMRFLSAKRKGNAQAVLQYYKELPKWIRNDRFLQAAWVESAGMVSDDEYRKALSDLARAHGNDPRMSLMLMEHYVFEKDYDRAHALVSQFSKMIGGDAALEALHANIAYEAGDVKEAVRFSRRAIQADRDYEDTYWTLLHSLVQDRHYEDAVLVLRILAGKFSYSFEPKQLAETPGFSGFAKSAEFQSWAD